MAHAPGPEALHPVPFTDVRVADPFWSEVLDRVRGATLPAIVERCRTSGRMENFRVAAARLAGSPEGRYRGERYDDTDVFKALEGACYLLMAGETDPALRAWIDESVALIEGAQEPDGYLYTARTASPEAVQPGTGRTRWSELAVSHELYNAGHLYEAAVAHAAATGEARLLDVARRNADMVRRTFVDEGRAGYPDHEEIEFALVRLFERTGVRADLELAAEFLRRRGRTSLRVDDVPEERFSIYRDPAQMQAHLPVLEQTEARGHAVRLGYLGMGLAAVAGALGDRELLAASRRLWEDVVRSKLYLTGGVGSRHDGERVGARYELPSETAYAETCAGIALAWWSHRLFLATGHGRYLDVLERALYNNVLAGLSLDGTAFFYVNPLESDGRYAFNKGGPVRRGWFDTACCPGNLARFLPGLPGLVYATAPGRIFVNLFISGSASLDPGVPVRIRQETRYPAAGSVRFRIEVDRPARLALHLRIPGWARGEELPSRLYRQAAPPLGAVELLVDGRPVELRVRRGFAVISRRWTGGETVELRLPVGPRRILPNPAIADLRGMAAIAAGPIVYCAEAPLAGDRSAPDPLGLVLPDDAGILYDPGPGVAGLPVLEASGRVGEVAYLEGTTDDRSGDEEGDPTPNRRRVRPSGPTRPARIALVPAFLWANRGPARMTVWLWRGRSSRAASRR